MGKILNGFYEFVDKIGKRNFILIIFIFGMLLVTGLYQTFSLYTESEGMSIVDGVKTIKFILSNNKENDSVVIGAYSSKYIDITVSNDSDAKLKYGLYFDLDDDMELANVNIGYLDSSSIDASGMIDGNDSEVVTVKVDNYSANDVEISLGLKYGFENGGDLILDKDQQWLEEYQKSVNRPNLDSGNLIPVYFDENYVDAKTNEIGAWRKADSSNLNNSWYDYDSKMWANAVMISDYDKLIDYRDAVVDTIINSADVMAFYVWIPRFKYRVFNMTRKSLDESAYSYLAYSKGIDIEYEFLTNSTGNVECDYDIETKDEKNVLADKCYYNGDYVSINDDNKDYKDAWYTHPAFTFGGKNLEGFWIGKYETTGEIGVPTILPDSKTLTGIDIADLFINAKVFQSHLSNEMDAHMLTNLEWGAVSYLTHSIYGLCDDKGCEGVNHNNSSGYYTGRSGGDVAVKVLDLATIYGDDSVDLLNQYNEFGYYDYRGYQLDSNGKVTSIKDITRIASTTKNITGVYDMSGGGIDLVMSNMISANNKPTFDIVADKLKDNTWYDASNNSLASKYYNSYSYGILSNSFNRSRLGDALGEVLKVTDDNATIWDLELYEDGFYSFVYGDNVWLTRGGSYIDSSAGMFISNGVKLNEDVDMNGYVFRSSLS